jgi:hypothetical protein
MLTYVRQPRNLMCRIHSLSYHVPARPRPLSPPPPKERDPPPAPLPFSSTLSTPRIFCCGRLSEGRGLPSPPSTCQYLSFGTSKVSVFVLLYQLASTPSPSAPHTRSAASSTRVHPRPRHVTFEIFGLLALSVPI